MNKNLTKTYFKLFIYWATLLIALFSNNVFAGCANFENAYAWEADNYTNKITARFGNGKVDECANMNVGFQSFENSTILLGHSVCYNNCNRGVKPNQQYVQINKVVTEGNVTRKNNTTCIQSNNDKSVYYCWNQGNLIIR